MMLSMMTISELAAAYRTGTLSPVEVVDQCLSEIALSNEDLNAFIHVSVDAARLAARQAERLFREGAETTLLTGVPVAHKDNLCTIDAPTTAHSRVFRDPTPRIDATVVARLRDAGMISIGKTNLAEFACGGMELYGTPRNPWHLDRYAGGSSGGSAAAVAAGLVQVATGTDTAGSIRVPASFCGLVGVKPTRGLVSNFGVVPLSWTMDTVGPITRTVGDAALVLEAMSGYDRLDRFSSSSAGHDLGLHLLEGVRGMKVGVPSEHFFDGLPVAIDSAVQDVLEGLGRLGAEIVPVSMPLAVELAAAGAVLVMIEAYAVHAATITKQSAEYSSRARHRIMAGGRYSQADVHAAQSLSYAWTRQLDSVMRRVDVLVTPTLPITAFPHEHQHSGPPDTSWGTRHFSMAGLPAMTVPCGFDNSGLPIGVQVVGKRFEEATMFRVGSALEAVHAPSRRSVPYKTATRQSAIAAEVNVPTTRDVREGAARDGLPVSIDETLEALHDSFGRLPPMLEFRVPDYIPGVPASHANQTRRRREG